MEMVIHPPIPTEGMDASHKGLQQMADVGFSLSVCKRGILKSWK